MSIISIAFSSKSLYLNSELRLGNIPPPFPNNLIFSTSKLDILIPKF